MSNTYKERAYVECGKQDKSLSTLIRGYLHWTPVHAGYANPPVELGRWPDAWHAQQDETTHTVSPMAGEWCYREAWRCAS